MDKIGKQVRHTYNNVAKAYYEGFYNETIYFEYLKKFLQLVPGKSILDIGCGVGNYSKFVSDQGFLVDALDFSEKLIKIAKNKAKNVNFYIMDMKKIKLKKLYDGIMIINSSFHVKKSHQENLFKSLSKLLVSGGIAFVVILEGDGEEIAAEPLNPKYKEYICYFNQAEIEAIFENSGFKVISKKNYRRNFKCCLRF